ncbi:MAG: hypothetical protein SFX74_07450 [Fimbriimonadaceae bacterium]|nr:hypothetical protein [Fimbriimonadaceae bacterium]
MPVEILALIVTLQQSPRANRPMKPTPLGNLRVIESKGYRRLRGEFAMGNRMYKDGVELDRLIDAITVSNELDRKVVFDLGQRFNYLEFTLGIRDRIELNGNELANHASIYLDGKLVARRALVKAPYVRVVLDVRGVRTLTVRSDFAATLAQPMLVPDAPALNEGDLTNLLPNG